MIKKAFIFSFLALFIAVSGFSATADAKRFGGGMSFGKSYSKQKSYSSPTATQNKSLNSQNSPAGKSGMMGMLGGLAMGGLLGALFFGGAFEGVNMFDILLLGAIAFGIMWFMRRTAGQQRQYAHAGNQQVPFGHQAQDNNDAFQAHEQMQTTAKPDIDEAHFIEAARSIFMRMQADWDNKNISDIRSFCTADIASHIEADMQKSGDNQNKTEVSFLDASIADTWLESGLEWVAVRYKAMLKEETYAASGELLESENSQLNEIWVFQHNPKSKDPTWYLAGIQQA